MTTELSTMTTRSLPIPDPGAAPTRGQRVARTARRGLLDFAFLVLGLVTGTIAFTVVVTLVSLSVSLLILIIGVPVALASSVVLRWIADGERWRAGLVRAEPVRGAYLPLGRGFLSWCRQAVRDPQRWKDIAYELFQFPLSVAGFCVAVVSWSAALAFLTYPAWSWTLPKDQGIFGPGTTPSLRDFPESLATIPVGLILIVAAYWLCRAFAWMAGELAAALLGASERAAMRARIAALETARAGAVDVADADLKRIERDLHDGTQARLVAVAMDLGMAEEKMDGDPAAAQEHVQAARGQATLALAELRDLVRGIAPSILTDRGLDAALSSLVARSPVPVTIDVELPGRPPATAETAAYYAVSEALANVAKHAQAAHCDVTVRRDGGQLAVTVRDDGRGGATVAPGGGLAGLRDRLAALDGELRVTSPPGGPTVIEARIPCAS
jgi:signal transduction histidine kinase